MKENFTNEINMEINNVFKGFFLVIFFLLNHSAHSTSFENKILYKIDNEIITSYDLELEKNYLKTLNPTIQNLKEEEIYRIAKKSIINEKIKIIEISKYFKSPKIPMEYLNNLSKNIYRKIGISNLEEFKNYLNNNKIDYTNVLKKIEIEALWNELIYSKYSEKVKIDLFKLREEVVNNINESNKSYLMSEILFEVDKTENIQTKYLEIRKMILEKGFENAALKYSSSSTANIGGKLDWIDSNSLNKIIKNAVKNLKKNEFTKPIVIAGGFIVLKVNDIKINNNKKNIELELEKLVNSTKNNQLNQYSIIHFNKIKQDIEINEI